MRDPGTAALMVEAMELGADVVGGMPHWELNEVDQREHVRYCFELARALQHRCRHARRRDG